MKERAHVAYDGYAAFTGGKTFDGRDMPRWDQLPDRIKGAWRAAIAAISTNTTDGGEGFKDD